MDDVFWNALFPLVLFCVNLILFRTFYPPGWRKPLVVAAATCLLAASGMGLIALGITVGSPLSTALGAGALASAVWLVAFRVRGLFRP